MIRAQVLQQIRNHLSEQDFVEVETPVLCSQKGGATAKAFETWSNDLQRKMYLRIAPELYLKRLLVAGFDKVFEIGKNFRNEDIDPSHSPEFSFLEAY